MNTITASAIVATALAIAAPASAQQHDHGQAQQAPVDHSQHQSPSVDHSQMDHSQHQAAPDPHAGHDMSEMTGLLGNYAMGRDASGTAWQPDVSSHGGVHAQTGEWRLMGHVMLNGVYDWQEGPRGDEKAFLAGMLMGAARRDFADGTLNFRVMASPDPFMGKDGYPLLFAAGETANGTDTLVDRQHPHDLLMELSASYSHRLGERDSVFLYAGLPGEPAFGPPAFMHRLAAMDSPEAPLTHHWFDSTHITFGVVTAGWVHDNVKLEISQFRGREPDQDRFDIESGDLDFHVGAGVVESNPEPRTASLMGRRRKPRSAASRRRRTTSLRQRHIYARARRERLVVAHRRIRQQGKERRRLPRRMAR